MANIENQNEETNYLSDKKYQKLQYDNYYNLRSRSKSKNVFNDEDDKPNSFSKENHYKCCGCEKSRLMTVLIPEALQKPADNQAPPEKPPWFDKELYER